MTAEPRGEKTAAAKSFWVMPAICLAAGAAGGILAMLAWDQFGPRPRMDVHTQKLVEQAILANPQIIPDAIGKLQQNEVERLLASNREAVETPFNGAWAGAEDGDVVLVEFFDFNCPFCRQSNVDVERLLKEDPKLKIVYRDFPVLGPDSEKFARASLAAAMQGQPNYMRFYRQVFSGQGALSQERLIAAVRAAKVNEGKLAVAMDSGAVKEEIDRNLQSGRALGLTGTPSYIVGNRILSGAVGYEALRKAIEETRAAR